MKTFCLLAAALVAAAPAAGQKPTTVVPIDLHSFGYTPSPISLRAGQQVTLVFTNSSGISHEFKAKAFFDSAKVVAGSVPEGEIDLKPHESRSVTLVPAAGTYRAHCGHFLHTQMGMTTTIYVQ